MFRSIVEKIQRDEDLSLRAYTLDVLARVRDGALYDHLANAFHDERNRAGEYVPLRDRRPSVKTNLCRIVVDDAVALLFSEGHFPDATVEGVDGAAEFLRAIIKEGRLNEVMIEAAVLGSVGSAAIHMRVLRQKDGSHRVFFAPHATAYLTPTFRPEAPDVLARMDEAYKVQGRDLSASGYPIEAKDADRWFWFARRWDEDAETWFQPWPVVPATEAERAQAANPVADAARSVTHGLGFVPWVWIRNLPGKLKLLTSDGAPRYSALDGACTFDAAIDTVIEIDYQLSQAGRGLKYTMDPMLVLKEPPVAGKEFVKSPANAVILDEKGDAKLLEIEGAAFTVVLDFVRALREMALESVHGNRAEASKLSSAQSGRAMELMNQALIWLADKMRISYGEYGLRQLLAMALRAHEKYPISAAGQPLPAVAPGDVKLKWPRWYQPTAHDRQSDAQTLKLLGEAGALSRETAVASIAADYDVEDVPAEIARIETDERRRLDLVPVEGREEQIRVNA